MAAAVLVAWLLGRPEPRGNSEAPPQPLSVEGVRLGMTFDQVVALQGHPPQGETALTMWEIRHWGALEMVRLNLQPGRKDDWRVSMALGRRLLDRDGRAVLRAGDRVDDARSVFGPPRQEGPGEDRGLQRHWYPTTVEAPFFIDDSRIETGRMGYDSDPSGRVVAVFLLHQKP